MQLIHSPGFTTIAASGQQVSWFTPFGNLVFRKLIIGYNYVLSEHSRIFWAFRCYSYQVILQTWGKAIKVSHIPSTVAAKSLILTSISPAIYLLCCWFALFFNFTLLKIPKFHSFNLFNCLNFRKTVSLAEFDGHCPAMIEEVEESAMEQADRICKKCVCTFS